MMKKRHNNKNGFTLLEVLIALSISTLLLSGVLTMIQPANQLFYETGRLQEQREIIRSVSYGVNERVRYATDIVIVKNTSAEPTLGAEYADHSILFIDNHEQAYNDFVVKGRVMLKNKATDATYSPILSKDVYSKYSCEINAHKEGYNFDLDFHLYRFKKNGTVEDSFTVNNKIYLKNFSIPDTTFMYREVDASTMGPQPIAGMTIMPAGEDTYIIYK